MNRQPPPLRESELMGRAPVLVLVMLSGSVGVLRLFGVNVSMILAQFGGYTLDIAWSLALIASAVLVIISWGLRDPEDSAFFEVIGLLLHVVAVAAYIFAVLYETADKTGALFVLAYFTASVVNCLGRAVLLLRRMRWVHKAAR